MKSKKCLHKVLGLGGYDLLVLGGEVDKIEVFNYHIGKPNNNHPCIGIFKNLIKNLELTD